MSRIKLGVLSSAQTLVDKTRELAIEKNIDIISAYVGLDGAIQVAQEMEAEGAEVILARGGTAALIRNRISIPLLSFPLSTIDILTCIKEAAQYGRNILLVSFHKKMNGIEFLNELFNIRMTQSVCENFNDMKQLISTHYHKYDAMVGGATSSAVAKQYALTSIETQTSEEAIESTLDSAISVARYNRREQEKSHRYSLIIDGVSDGVIAYDRDGKITLINDTASRLLRFDYQAGADQSFLDILPSSTGVNVLSAGVPIEDKIERVGNELFVFNHIPIVINSDTVGGVTTFKDASNVIEIEGEIRRSLSRGLIAKYDLSNMVCESPEMRKLVKRMKRFSSTDSTLLVLGETGTGKELLAQSIHNLSNRSKQPFVSINCAALSEELLQSELFGYEEGAFTGSRKGGKPGLFELAHEGTIFLDEINATSQNVQRHLLRVLQEKEVMRIGADRITPINVRVIAASNTELIEEVYKGRFREDLFFRLNVLNLRIPPLKERLDDLPLLVDKFLTDLGRRYKRTPLIIPVTHMQKLKSYHWPGNVRQLQNFLERFILITDDGFEPLVFEELCDELYDYQGGPIQSRPEKASSDSQLPAPQTAVQSERETIQQALESTGYHKTKTAGKLGISRTTLWKKMKKYSL